MTKEVVKDNQKQKLKKQRKAFWKSMKSCRKKLITLNLETTLRKSSWNLYFKNNMKQKNEISNISKEVKQMKEKGGVIENVFFSIKQFSLTKQAYNEISTMFNELLSIYTSSSKDDESYTKSVPNSIL